MAEGARTSKRRTRPEVPPRHLAQQRATADATPEWAKALIARSDALDRKYRLGSYAQQRTTADATPEWTAALNTRSEALDRKYRLGKYAGK